MIIKKPNGLQFFQYSCALGGGGGGSGGTVNEAFENYMIR